MSREQMKQVMRRHAERKEAREDAARFLDAAERDLRAKHPTSWADVSLLASSLRDFLQTWDGGK